ncbi:MAG: DUF4358 domain-containing protein [Ruminiclostridium sp.]|nr:DUF4358 domain-containing protein [Ruminiclostridium sp.]
MKKILSALLMTGIMLFTACNADTPSNASVTESDSSNSSSAVINSDISIESLCETVLNSVEFPAMSRVEMAEMLDMIMDFSKYGIDEYSVYQQVMSVHLCEVIIVRTSNVDDTLNALEGRKNALINQLAFYPEQQQSAQNTVVGSKNGICYLIAHADAKTAEKALLQKI